MVYNDPKKMLADILRDSLNQTFWFSGTEFGESFLKDYKSRILRTDDETQKLLSSRDIRAYMDNVKSRLKDFTPENMAKSWSMANQIVDELITGTSSLTNEDVNTLLPELRPMLTGRLYAVDLEVPSSPYLYDQWNSYLQTKDINYYHMFRSGLDFLDLDSITYKILKQNLSDMGYWYPKLKCFIDEQDFFIAPKTFVVQVPLPLLQMSRLDYNTLGPVTMKIVDDYCIRAFGLDPAKTYFLRTGVCSAKESFRDTLVKEDEVLSAGEKLLSMLRHCALMAAPTRNPRMYGGATTTTWVAREYIPDPEHNPTVRNGQPLRTEFRVFVDLHNPTPQILGIKPRWDHDITMRKLSALNEQDCEVFKAHEPLMMQKYNLYENEVCKRLKEMFSKIPAFEIGLGAQWSVDIMLSGREFYIIDMALAQDSALNNCIPDEDKCITTIDWIPGAVLNDFPLQVPFS